MILKEIGIENYKSISSLLFSPKKINVIVGKNNTGKTSILEAIDLFFHQDKIEMNNMKSLINISAKERTIKMVMKLGDREDNILVREATEEEIFGVFKREIATRFLGRLSETEKALSDGPLSSLQKEIENVVVESIDKDIRNLLLKNSLVVINSKNEEKIHFFSRGVYYSTPKIEAILSKVADHIINSLKLDKKKYGPPIMRAAEETIFDLSIFRAARNPFKEKKIADPKEEKLLYIKNLLEGASQINRGQERTPELTHKVHNVEKIIKERHLINNLVRFDVDNVILDIEGQETALPFSFLGDGFKAMVGLLWSFSSTKINDSIILLDEPESHMHPGYIMELVKVISSMSEKQNVQFFITTHSPDLIDTFLSQESYLERERPYLQRELAFIKMDKIKEIITIPEILDYDAARENKEQFLLDLRGIA